MEHAKAQGAAVLMKASSVDADQRVTHSSFRASVPRLLRERRMSLRALARRADLDVAHLSRAIRGVGGKRPNGHLARRVAVALDLPPHYFPEARELAVVELVAANPSLRDQLFVALS